MTSRPSPDPADAPRRALHAGGPPEGAQMSEQGEPTPYDSGLREGFRRALAGEVPWFPIPGNEHGVYFGNRLPVALSEPIHGTVETLGRILDPVRAAALHEAVRFFPYNERDLDDEEGPAPLAEVLAAAAMFEAWLQGPAEFDRYLAEVDQATETP